MANPPKRNFIGTPGTPDAKSVGLAGIPHFQSHPIMKQGDFIETGEFSNVKHH